MIATTTTTGYARVLQQTHYYPFGMRMSEISTTLTDSSNHYLYNGKEFYDDFDLNWYDYGARFYDPALGRFHSIDPLADDPKNISLIPYHYCNGNPILFIDINGEDWFLNNQTGALMFAARQKELSEEYLNNYGLEVNLSDYERVGADEMFDTEDSKVGDTGTEFNFMSGEYAKGFLTGKGYEMLTESTVVEKEFVSEDYEPSGKIETKNNWITQSDKIKIAKIQNNETNSEVKLTNSNTQPISHFEKGFMYSYETTTTITVNPYNPKTFKGSVNNTYKRSRNSGGKNLITSIFTELVTNAH